MYSSAAGAGGRPARTDTSSTGLYRSGRLSCYANTLPVERDRVGGVWGSDVVLTSVDTQWRAQ